MNLTLYKIDACRFDYEYLGKSFEDLATQYQFPIDSLKAEADERGWVRKIEPTVMPETRSIQEFANALEEVTRSKLSIISLFRQIENQPIIAQIEKVFLEKALELGASLSPLDDKASSKLGQLSKAVATMQDRNPIDLADQLKEAIDGGGKARVVVNIANQIN